jgi:predicted cobalt transporter CbtA
MRTFLIRGMLAGLCAAALAFGFAKVMAEPAIDGAIAFEDQQYAAMSMPAEPEIVSRTIQSTIGLATGLVATGIALGGFFSIGFAFAYGRLGQLSARATAAVIGLFGFIAVYFVPFVKYPGNPPAIGNPDTIGQRTTLYFLMIAVSILALVLAIIVGRSLLDRLGAWNATLIGAGTYVAVMVLVIAVLPVIEEVPDGFPANTLWQFRFSSIVTQLVLWGTIGLLFGALTERAATKQAEVDRAGWRAPGRVG